MEKLHRDSDAYTRDYNVFVNELRQFHQSRGTAFRHTPRVNGRGVDLYLLYRQVTALGGWQKVNDGHKLDGVLDSLKLPKACANVSLALRQIYIRYLGHYEKIHFLGEDPDDDNDQTPEGRNRKHQATQFHNVPMCYNHAQHDVTDLQRSTMGLCQTLLPGNDYNKLCLSLLSGLPNEQDFALNICTLLSNEGRHVLRLEKIPRLVDLLVAQTGIFPDGDSSLACLYKESWEGVEGRQMSRFWQSTVNVLDQDVLDLLRTTSENATLERRDEELFNLGGQLGSRNTEGQRVLRIALILYNLSFETNNVPVLSSNSSCLRFLLLCVHCQWSYLRQVALDTLGNLAGNITISLKADLRSRLMLRTVSEGIDSNDRFVVLRSLEILAHLAQLDSNDEVLACCIDFKVFQRIMTLLTIHDIMLLVYSLEALYSLSELGRRVCEKILRVHKAVATLVSLLTLDPQISGPGEGNFKLVETFEPVSADALATTNTVTNSPPPPTPIATPVPLHNNATSTPVKGNVLQASAPSTPQEVDSESFACHWLRSAYEMCQGSSVSRNDLYAEYVSHCSKIGKKCVVNANVFANCVKNVFPQSGLRKIETGTNTIMIHHDNLRRKPVVTSRATSAFTQGQPLLLFSLIDSSQSALAASTPSHGTPTLVANLGPPPRSPSPLSVAPSVATGSSASGSHSPILKAQLSAPLRSMTPPLTPTGGTPSISPSPPPSPSPSLSPNTNLIKSLLASKVSRNMQRQQQQLQDPPMATLVTNGSKACLSQATTTQAPVAIAVRNVNPMVKVATPVRVSVPVVSVANPLSASVINKIKKEIVLSPKINKALEMQPGIVLNTRLNGIIRDTQLEVCAQVEDAESLPGPILYEEANIERVQNHLNDEDEDGSSSDSFDPLTMLGLKPPKNQNGMAVKKEPDNAPLIKTVLAGDDDNSKRRVYKASPLLNGLLDKGRLLPGEEGLPNGNGETDSNDAESVQYISAPEGSTVLIARTVEQQQMPQQIQIVQNSNGGAAGNAPIAIVNMADVANQSASDLSSISDIARTLECASKAISRTNAECNSQQLPIIAVPSSAAGGGTTTHIVSVLRLNPQATITLPMNAGLQQFLQAHLLRLPSPTMTLKMDDASELIGLPQISAAQLRQLQAAGSITSGELVQNTLKRPSSGVGGTPTTCYVLETKRPRMEAKSSLLETSLRTEDSVTSPPAAATVMKSGFQEQRLLLPKPRTDETKLVPVQSTMLLHSKGSTVTVPVSTAQLVQQSTTMVLASATNVLSTSSATMVFAGSPQTVSMQQQQQTVVSSVVPVTTAATQSNVLVMQGKRPAAQTATTLSPAQPTGHLKQVANQETTKEGTSQSTPQPQSDGKSSKLHFVCEWRNCHKRFISPNAVFFHVQKVHMPALVTQEALCEWDNCDKMKRKKLSLLTHVQDRHCNEQLMQMQALRKHQLAQFGKSSIPPPQPPPPHPGYAPDAALLAIRRHALQYLCPREFVEEKEGPLTKSIRLTASLVLRNLAFFCPSACSQLRQHEPELAGLAMSTVESSRTIAQCLLELARPRLPSHHD